MPITSSNGPSSYHLAPPSERRIAMHGVLEPNNASHTHAEINVSLGELKALQAANAAIDDTWRVLNYGSGNQTRHVKGSDGESFKRTTLAYNCLGQVNTGYADPRIHNAFVAASVQAGNCDQMADVNALLLSMSGINQQVSKVHANDIGHAFVMVGDPRETSRLVVSDAWPEFGRAMRYQDYALQGDDPRVVQTYENYHSPETRERLLTAATLSQEQIDSAFARAAPRMPISGAPLVKAVLENNRTYIQAHGSKNLAATYVSRNPYAPGRVDQSLSQEQLSTRARRSGIEI